MKNTDNSEFSKDPFNLERFLTAQLEIFPTVLSELRSGRKRSHWKWFIFPQIDGLGFSPTAMYYAIKSLEEARAYLNHPNHCHGHSHHQKVRYRLLSGVW